MTSDRGRSPAQVRMEGRFEVLIALGAKTRAMAARLLAPSAVDELQESLAPLRQLSVDEHRFDEARREFERFRELASEHEREAVREAESAMGALRQALATVLPGEARLERSLGGIDQLSDAQLLLGLRLCRLQARFDVFVGPRARFELLAWAGAFALALGMLARLRGLAMVGFVMLNLGLGIPRWMTQSAGPCPFCELGADRFDDWPAVNRALSRHSSWVYQVERCFRCGLRRQNFEEAFALVRGMGVANPVRPG